MCKLSGAVIVRDGTKGNVLYMNKLGFYIIWWPSTQSFSALEKDIVEFYHVIPWTDMKDRQW